MVLKSILPLGEGAMVDELLHRLGAYEETKTEEGHSARTIKQMDRLILWHGEGWGRE